MAGYGVRVRPHDRRTALGAVVTARGIRNNNPGNIRLSTAHWQGTAVIQGDPAFVTFTAMEYGVRALARTLLTYQRSHGLRTITGIISRWAPGVENDTAAYIRAVALSTGYHSAAILNLADRATLWRVVAAIIKHECGKDSVLVLPATISRGVNLALQA